MIESKDSWGAIRYEEKECNQQVATIFRALLYAAVAGMLKNGEAAGFLDGIDPTTQLTNKTLVARAAKDLNSPNGNIIVEVINAGEDESPAYYTTTSLPVQTSNNKGVSDKPTVMISLNANSSQFRQVKEGGFFFFKRGNTRLTLNPSARLQILQEVVASQVVLEKTLEGTYMTRAEYFALRGQTTNS